MSEPVSKFGWYELMTTDTEAAGKFYASVVGWSTHDVGNEYMAYTTFNVGEVGIAGMMSLPPDAGPMPAWIGYIHVPDTDAYVEKVVAAGGQLHKGPTDVPGMLRFAVMLDAQGAPFVLFTSDPAMPTPERPAPGTPGTFSWNELMAADGDAALAFYSGLFGWTKGQTHNMGPMGIYQIFDADGAPLGGMMTKPAAMPSPFWNFYIQVESVKAAAEAVESGGGKVLNGPHQVPGGSWVLQGMDPQGGAFNLISAGE